MRRWVYCPPTSGKSSVMEAAAKEFFDVDKVSDIVKDYKAVVTGSRYSQVKKGVPTGVFQFLQDEGLTEEYENAIVSLSFGRLILSNIQLDLLLNWEPPIGIVKVTHEAYVKRYKARKQGKEADERFESWWPGIEKYIASFSDVKTFDSSNATVDEVIHWLRKL